MSTKLPIMEIFGPTIQGEGIMAGRITHFVRTGGCSLRCAWCDEMRSVHPESVQAFATWMTPEEVADAVGELSPASWVTLTGGDPCIHEKLDVVVRMLNAQGRSIAVETQGMHFPEWLSSCDSVTFSPKGPGSGNPMDVSALCDWLKWMHTAYELCIKIVINTYDEQVMADDFQYAVETFNKIRQTTSAGITYYISAMTPQGLKQRKIADAVLESYRRMVEYLLQLQREVSSTLTGATEELGIGELDHGTNIINHIRTCCQQHVLLWPGENVGR